MSYDFDDEDLRTALKRLDENFLDSLPDKEDLNYKFSAKFEKKMDRLIGQVERVRNKGDTRRNKLNLWKIGKRVAIILITMIVVFTSALNVSAVREVVFNIISKVYESYTEIFSDVGSTTKKGKFIVRKPKYIPEGFELESEDTLKKLFLKYAKGDEYIIYEQKQSDGSFVHMNSENADLEEIRIKGYKAKYNSNIGVQNVIWYDGDYVYSVSSTLSKEEVTKIAESVYDK